MNQTVVALLHPGDMGSAIGATLRERGIRVAWSGAGRGASTRERAAAAGLEDRGSLAACLDGASVALSVCPPHAAVDLAAAVAATGFRGVFVDGNAIAPDTARRACALIEAAGGAFVDGGIVGPPPRAAGRTRLFLSGDRAVEVAALFDGTLCQAIVVDGGIGAASAVKLCYAAWTKGSLALLAALRVVARHEGVEAALLAEWGRSQPDLAKRSESITAQAHKAWRWVGEMDEIAAGFAAAGMPAGFHQAAGEVYAALEGFKGRESAPGLDEVLKMLGNGNTA